MANAKHGRSGASFDWTDEMIAEKRDRHRDIGGSPYMPSLLGLPCARAPRPSAATCGPGQPVPGSCPASPSAAAGLAVPPAITLQSLRRRHRRQFCSPQPWQLEGQQYTTTTASHTPRWPAPSAPHGPAQPPFASAIASSASNQVAPSSSANAAAAPRQRPGRLADLQPAMPPPPHPLGSTSSTSRLEPGGHGGLDHCFSTSHGDNSVFQEPILRPS